MTEIDLDELMENLAQCRRCGICRNAVYEDMGFDGICPVWKNTAGFETSFMRGKLMVAIALLEGRLEKTADNAEALYSCSLCGNCTEICAAEFNPTKSLELVRAVLSDIPNEARDTIAERILTTNNAYVTDKKGKRDWVADLGFKPATKADTLYYFGCTAGMKLPETAKAAAKLLKAAGIEFAVLEDEPCCGSVMIRTGRLQDAEENAKKVLESIQESGAKTVLVSCAGCLKTLRKDYPEKFNLSMPKVVHFVEYFLELVKSRKIKLNPLGENVKITYHDPCHMGRELGIYEEPRNLLKAIPGVELVEMETNRRAAMCCGAGGGLRSYDPELSKKIAADRVREAEKAGAEIIANACPFCEQNLESGAKLLDSSIRVADIVDLIVDLIE